MGEGSQMHEQCKARSILSTRYGIFFNDVQPVTVAHICNPKNVKVEQGGSGSKCQSRVNVKFEARIGYMRPCPK